MAWGEDAAERHEMVQVADPVNTPDSVEAAREKVRAFNEKYAAPSRATCNFCGERLPAHAGWCPVIS